MSKRVTYPILLFSFFLFFNVGSRTFIYAFDRAGATQFETYTFLAVLEFLFSLVVPSIILYEAKNRKNVRNAVFLVYLFSLANFIHGLLQLNNVQIVSDSTTLVLQIIILCGVVYFGSIRIRDDHDDIRLGRSFITFGVVMISYIMILPNTLQRTSFNYEYFMLNPFMLILYILQALILDDLIIDNEQIRKSKRVTLKG